jgi:LPXTG-site transpeptidase (sortase) family protein
VDHFRLSASNYLKRLLKWPKTPFFLVFVGFFLLSFGGFNYYRVRTLSFDKVPEEVKMAIQKQEIDIPTEVIIPSVNINLPIDPGQIKNGVWQISSSKATFLATSASPGRGGNTVIYGHNKKAIFGNLPYLSIGQKITIKTKSGKSYDYVATEKFFVDPDRVDLVSPTDIEELTLYTCWGTFDGQRAVIKATPI